MFLSAAMAAHTTLYGVANSANVLTHLYWSRLIQANPHQVYARQQVLQ